MKTFQSHIQPNPLVMKAHLICLVTVIAFVRCEKCPDGVSAKNGYLKCSEKQEKVTNCPSSAPSAKNPVDPNSYKCHCCYKPDSEPECVNGDHYGFFYDKHTNFHKCPRVAGPIPCPDGVSAKNGMKRCNAEQEAQADCPFSVVPEGKSQEFQNAYKCDCCYEEGSEPTCVNGDYFGRWLDITKSELEQSTDCAKSK